MDEPATQVMIAAFSALLGGGVGYRLGLASERRKEYNEIADRLFLKVNQELREHSAGHFYIDDGDVALMRRRMGPLQRRRFDSAYSGFVSASKEKWTDAAGQSFFRDVDSVNAALKELASVLKRR